MAEKARVVMRHFIQLLCFWLPRERRKKLERWLRGREEFKKLQRADWVLMSWGKSGRTWLRVMLSRAYQLKGGLAATELLDFDNLKRRDSRLPAVFFTHDNYLRDYTGNSESKDHFKGKRIVLLVRDPRDVAVSQFFQWQFRMRPNKKFINDYPPHGADITTWDFVLNPRVGVPRIIDFFNAWARAIPQHKCVLVVRYEDMRADPGAALSQIMAFTETSLSIEHLRDAVDFADYDNMKKMEQNKFFKGSGARVKPGDKDNPQSFKVRKAKVGGFRDYFSDDQCGELEKMMEGLDPMFGYAAEQS
jgi:hypothetical protein